MGRISVYIQPAALSLTIRAINQSISYSDDRSVCVFRVEILEGIDLIVIGKAIGTTGTWSVSIFGKEFLIPDVSYLVYDFDIVSVTCEGIILDVQVQTHSDRRNIGRLMLHTGGAVSFNDMALDADEVRRFQAKALLLYGGSMNGFSNSYSQV